MSDRLDPPPVTPVTPHRPSVDVRRQKFPTTLLVLALGVAVVLGLAWWALMGRRAGSGSVSVPADMGGAVPASALNRLFDDADDAALNGMNLRLAVGKDGERPVYRVGDVLRVGFACGEDARCALYHRDARGALQLVHPEGKSASVRADDEQVAGELKVSEPVGDESFLLVCLPGADAGEGSLADALAAGDERAKLLSARRVDFEVREP